MRMHITKMNCRSLGVAALIATVLFPISSASAQRDLTNIPSPDPELERASFVVADGFEVNLFASDPLLASPIQMSFDAEGRLWVATSEIYPHIKPGQEATDKVIVLEDTDGDGAADKTQVFADDLLIPTGVLPGDGGAYVVNSTELLHLRDSDGDGRADERRVVLSGFGTEDTHHLLHMLRWGPDGALYMNQSIYIHSHVETPHGVKRLNGGGIWRFRPETMQLDVFCRGFVNPWGHHFDKWGQSFATDGAYGEGINYVFPGAVYVTAVGAVRRVEGLNPGSPKHCGLEILSGQHLPDDWQGNMITNDFRAHRVCRFVVEENGSGYTSRQETELIKSTHVAFRPVDVRMGPDGAIYIADWYNPIIQHGEVDFRDPRRDHVHGRIWRVTAKNRPLVERPNLVAASSEQLLEHLRDSEEWNRLHAKLILKQRGADEVLPLLAAWLTGLDPQDPNYERLRLEGLWLHQCLNSPNAELLAALLASPDHRVRAAAMRVVPQWKGHLSDAFALLARGVADEHPRVRLEAVRGLAEEGAPEAAATALGALDQPMDAFLDFALWQCMRDLSPAWLPLVRDGQLDFGGRVEYLTFALRAVDSPDVARPLLDLVRTGKIAAERLDGVLSLVARLGGPAELQSVLEMALDSQRLPAATRVVLLNLLRDTYRLRKVKPEGDVTQLARLFEDEQSVVRVAALRTAGAFGAETLRTQIENLARSATTIEVRAAALEGLAALGGEPSVTFLEAWVDQAPTAADRVAAVRSLALIDVARAAIKSAQLLAQLPPDVEPGDVVGTLLAQQGGQVALAAAVAKVEIKPDIAKVLVRSVRESGRPDESLLGALEQAGGLANAGWKHSPELVAELVQQSRDLGDPYRGELVYRRSEMQCQKCHAIAAAGGRVGPDLSSIGASAQPDYLVESLLAPNAKVKENYHAVVVVADGKVTAGIPLRQTEKELVLRDAQDQEVVIAIDAIEEQQEGRSLMPDGTVDTLTRQELLDLVRFLSELGKVGDFAVGNAPVIRQWEALVPNDETYQKIRRNSFDVVAADDPAFVWQPVYSLVSGELPVGELPTFLDATYVVAQASSRTAFVRCRIDVERAEPTTLHFNDATGLTLWVDGKPTPLDSTGTLQLDLAPGPHTLTFAVDQKQRTSGLRSEKK